MRREIWRLEFCDIKFGVWNFAAKFCDKILSRRILMRILFLRQRGFKFRASSFAVRSRLEFYLAQSVKILQEILCRILCRILPYALAQLGKISRKVWYFETAWNSARILKFTAKLNADPND
nr:hypothetical protein [uncultured Campylobacter sp.]